MGLERHPLPALCPDRTPGGRHGNDHADADLPPLRPRAGFAEVEVLPIENDFWRFYRLS